MKTFFKYLGILVGTVVFLAYLAFLFVLPRYDINQYKSEVQKIAKEQAKLDLDFENAQIITTPLLAVGAKIDKISVKLPDGSVLFSADDAKARISLPSILLLTVKVSCAEVNSPYLNLEIIDNKAFKLTRLVEEILNVNAHNVEEVTQEAEAEASALAFNPEWIRIKVPCVKLNNYKILINDLKSKHYLTLKGEELRLGYFNGKVVKFKTDAEFYSDEQKNISANIDINTFIPKFEPSLDEEDDKAQMVELPFINPVSVYREYDLKTNVDVKMKLRERNSSVISRGYVNIDDLTLKLSQLQLPKSYFHLKTRGHFADIDTDINFMENQNLKMLGYVNYGKHPKFDMTLKTSDIYFNNIIILAKAVLDSLHVRNDLNRIKMAGFIKADTQINTNFKKVVSNGEIKVQDGSLSIAGVGSVISDMKSLISLNDNVCDIKETSLNLAGAKVHAKGRIDEKAVADIDIQTEKIALPTLFNAFAPNPLKHAYRFNSGDFILNLKMQGKLDEAIAKIKFELKNFNFADRARTFAISDGLLKGTVDCNKTNLIGDINNSNLNISLPTTRSNLRMPVFEVKISDKNIDIPENDLFINNSKVTIKGKVLDYEKLSDIKFSANGKIIADDLVKLVGREFAPFINAKGSPNLAVTIDGNSKKQTLNAEITADANNYFTPINIESIQGKTTALRSTIDFKGNRTKIKNTGLFTKTITTDEEGNSKTNYDEILGIDGTIAGDTINLLKITMPKPLSVGIEGFRNSIFEIAGKMFVYGNVATPHLRGSYDITNLRIPDLMMTLDRGTIAFRGQNLDLSVQNLVANGSDFTADTTISLEPSSVLNINGMNVRSRLVDADKLMQVSDAAMKFVPQSSTSAPSASSAPADIPVVLRNGRFVGNTLKSGEITTGRTSTNFALARNILTLSNLRTNVFDGHVQGNISMNLISTLMEISLNGHDLDVQKALLQAAAMDNTLYGTADFTTDISLRGVSYEEQMKSLKGSVDFNVKDGQFGPFGKLENLIIAENIRQSEFFQTTLGQALNSLTAIDTTHFNEMVGHLTFADGIATLDPITSYGNALSLKLFGDMNLLKNTVDMKVRARLTSTIANMLGPLNYINPINIMNATGGMNVFTAKAFSLFCEAISPEEMDSIPAFENGYIDNNAAKFQLVVRGDVAKPLTLIKSFKWLALASDIERAKEFVNALPAGADGANYEINAETIQKAKENLQLEAQKAVEKAKEDAKKQAKAAVDAKKQEARAAAEAKKAELQAQAEAKKAELQAKADAKKLEAQKALEQKIEEQKNGKLGTFLKRAKDVKDQLDALEKIQIEQVQSEQ